MRGTVLLVDDHSRARRALGRELAEAGFAVVEAGNGSEAWKLFCQHRPDVVITDLVMPGGDGLELLNRIRVRSDVPVLLFTARGSLEHAAAAFKAGADEFVASDEAGVADLVALVDRARRGRRAEPQHPELETRLVGRSPAMRKVRERIAALAPLRAPVLVLGDRGSGRRTAVACLHELGATGGEELQHIACADFAPGERLPPTGAIHLAGVERLDPDGQHYWSRRLRDDATLAKQVRLIASTHLPRQELAQRLDPGLAEALLRFTVELPPLSERSEDVPDLADALLTRIAGELGRRVRLSAASRAELARRSWPGNATELARVLERCAAFTRGNTVRVQLVEEVLAEQAPALSEIRAQSAREERERLLDAIHRAGGNVSRAARSLGRSRGAVYRMIERHGIALEARRS